MIRKTRATPVVGMVAVLLIAGCRPSSTELKEEEAGPVLPVIHVDAEHSGVNRGDKAKPLVYEIPSGRGFILDTSGYAFRVPSQYPATAKSPNLIHVVLSKDQVYSLDWRANVARYAVTERSLRPARGSRPFDGLKKDQWLVVAIGHLDRGATSGSRKFFVLWAARVNVR